MLKTLPRIFAVARANHRMEPATAGGARFDSGVEAGSEISTQFDPMIAKVIVHAPTRREAAGRLAEPWKPQRSPD